MPLLLKVSLVLFLLITHNTRLTTPMAASSLLATLKGMFPPNYKENSIESFEVQEDELFETTTVEPKTHYPILIPKEIVTEKSKLLPTYEEEQNILDVIKKKGRVRLSTSEYFIRNCGNPKEKCPLSGDSADGERPQIINFANEPFYCRCDEDCSLYGDCCWTIADTLIYDNPFKCNRVQEQTIWAQMISRCPENESVSQIIKQHCESPWTLPPSEAYTYLDDIPVLKNQTLELYRNIYCAQCNKVEERDIFHWHFSLKCSQNFTPIEREKFLSSAKYQPGKRIWMDENDNQCGIFSNELELKKIRRLVPNIRFCRRNSIDFCPMDFSDSLTAALCESYTQYVQSRSGYVFKNPHCAQCYNVNNQRDLKCLHDKGLSTMTHTKMTPGSSGAELGSTGLSLLFDFDFGSQESYVGYEMKCAGEKVWDFLRQNCTDTVCPKDHIFDKKQSTCQPILLVQENSSSMELNTTCYVLIIPEGEYILLENKSILVNKTLRDKAVESLIFSPSEYEIWEGGNLSICARDLDLAFLNKFSPILNYISIAALSISVFFTAIHILLFFLIPKLRNLPGKNLFCLTLSLFISQVIFLAFIKNENLIICLAASITMHYLFLASFFWMNVMSFDIWRTFSRISKRSGRVFITYSFYAWGLPLGIVAASVSVDFFMTTGGGDDGFDRLKPLYGHNNLCWISQGLALFLFFALPVFLLILGNFVLFVLSARCILKQSRDAQQAFSNVGGSGKSVEVGEVDRMRLYAKLGLIMGLTWVLGFASGVSEWDVLYYPFVILNGLQGTFIFFAFDFKIKTFSLLKEKYGSSSNIRRRDTNTSTTTVKSTVRVSNIVRKIGV